MLWIKFRRRRRSSSSKRTVVKEGQMSSGVTNQEEDRKPAADQSGHINLKVKGQVFPRLFPFFFFFFWRLMSGALLFFFVILKIAMFLSGDLFYPSPFFWFFAVSGVFQFFFFLLFFRFLSFLLNRWLVVVVDYKAFNRSSVVGKTIQFFCLIFFIQFSPWLYLFNIFLNWFNL